MIYCVKYCHTRILLDMYVCDVDEVYLEVRFLLEDVKLCLIH